MNIYITLDYELFFGSKSGSVQSTIITPTEKILQIARQYGIKIIFFVDVGYLVKLQNQKKDFNSLEKDYIKITSQIKSFVKEGHSAELHVHPHWEDSYFNGKNWIFNTNRYKLSDFSKNEVNHIVKKYTEALTQISGKSPVAFRAGGWSAQPFKNIEGALIENNISIDSSVFPMGYYSSDKQFYDFRKIEAFKTRYNFSEDLVVEDVSGKFTEFPISSFKVSPFFFWKFALIKLLKQPKHLSFSDGTAITKTKQGILKLLFSYSHSVVSIDGYKASYLEKAFKKYAKETSNKGDFIIIGHPKAFSPYSLQKFSEFVKKHHNLSSFNVF
jgi:peptidoglycan/xylan/chitin deacetylase (PgdA/CDA1 family)